MNAEQNNGRFIKEILLKVGFEDNEAMPLLIEQTTAIFDDRMQGEILSALSKDQMLEFDKIVSSDTEDKDIYLFFEKSIDNFDKFMNSLYSKFEKMYISEQKKALK